MNYKAALLTPFALLMPAAALAALPQLGLLADPAPPTAQLTPLPEAEADPGLAHAAGHERGRQVG